MTPEQHEEVRRALASVPPAPDMPPEVAARLDARIADLVAERGGSAAAPEPADDLAARRRRRLLPRMLVAAALAVVVGVGLGTLLDDITSGGMDAMTADGAGGQSAPETFAEGGGDREAAPDVAQEGARQPLSKADGEPNRFLPTAQRIRLSSDTLRRDVSAIVDLHIPRALAQEDAASEEGGSPAAARRRVDRLFAPCEPPTTARGDRLVAVRLDGDPATLVLRKPAAGARVAQVYACGDRDALLARTRVSAR